MRYSQQSVVQGLVWMRHVDMSEWHVCWYTSLSFVSVLMAHTESRLVDT